MVEMKGARQGGAAARGDATEQAAFEVRTIAGVNASLGNAPGKGNNAAPFHALAKTWIQLVDAACNKNLQATEQMGHTLLMDLALIENHMDKLNNIKRTNAEQQAAYAARQQAVKEQIQEAQEQIVQRKQQLADARLHRQHLEEYEVVRGLIAEQTPRHMTAAKMEAVKRDMAAAEAEAARLERAFERRRKQAALLFAALDDLAKVQDDQELDTQPAPAAGAGAGGAAAAAADGGSTPAAMEAEEGEAEEGEADPMQEG